MNASVIQIVVSIGFLAFAIYKIVSMIQLSQKIRASEMWPVLQAAVADKNVVVHRTSKGGKSYIPEIGYKYTVMGNEYDKKKILRGIWTEKSAQKALDEFGNSVEIRYNPDNPKDHVSGQDKVRILDILFILVILIMAFVILIPLFL